MALDVADRMLTIVVTATLTSAAWIVVGSMTVERVGSAEVSAPMQPADTERPGVSPTVDSGDAAVAEANVELLIPVANVGADELVDSYADERGGGARAHEALDIMAAAGTPVIAAAPGMVEALFRSDDGGKTIYVRSNDRRTIYYYAHLQGYSPGLEEGQRVRRGQRIGFVGSTGNADPAAPHLHFAIMRTAPDANWWDATAPVDPYPLLGGK